MEEEKQKGDSSEEIYCPVYAFHKAANKKEGTEDGW